MSKEKIGFLQSRGLGDLVIALPIARYYHLQDQEVYWPVCEPFFNSMRSAAPWVHWIPIPVDSQGQFFAVEPMKRLKNFGISDENIIWLYQYLNTDPERTNPDFYAMMKFDQYKYAAAGVPFSHKWRLAECITRNPAREQALFDKLVKNPRYWVIQQHASDVSYDIDTAAIDTDAQIIEITEQTDNIWDWLMILERCEGMILIDSVFANIVDQLDLNPESDRYFMRKWNRHVDGNPVFLNEWSYLSVEVPDGVEFKNINPLAEARKKLGNRK